MPPTLGPITANMSLDKVVSRLSGQPAVDGVLVMGSGGTGKIEPWSDYDLFVVLSEQPTPLWLVLTTIDRRLAEIYFTGTETLDASLAATVPANPTSPDAVITRWLQTGRIAFDRSGRLQRAHDKFSRGQWIADANDLELYQTWFSVNYNLQQTARMLLSPDPVYLMSVDLRLLYTIHEVWSAYFKMRKLPGMGEKDQIRYLAEHDPEYLSLFGRCLLEGDRARKFEMYARLAALATSPWGGLWADGATAAQLRPDAAWRAGIVDKALAFWQSLILQ